MIGRIAFWKSTVERMSYLSLLSAVLVSFSLEGLWLLRLLSVAQLAGVTSSLWIVDRAQF